MRPLINKHENILVWVSISFCLSVWLYGLNRNLNLPFIGDSLGYVSRAKNMTLLGLMNHAPIEPFGIPIQTLGYSSLLSIIPIQILSSDSQLRSVVAIVQISLYMFSSFFLSRSVSLYCKINWLWMFIGFAFFWPGALIATEVMADSISLSLHLLLLGLSIRMITSNQKILVSAAVGLVFGLLVIVRPNSILISAVLVIALFASEKRPVISLKKVSRLLVIGVCALLVISPQIIWTYQQFNEIALIKIDDSFTNGIPITIGEQNARATFIQLNGCMPPVDCSLINRYPGPFSWRSQSVTGSDFPVWNEWLKSDPGYALMQAGLILLASLDQEFFFTYIQYPHEESNRFSLFALIFVMIIGLREIFHYLRSDRDAKLMVAVLVLAVIAPYMVFQFSMFHAENRYGLVPAALLFSLAFNTLIKKQSLLRPPPIMVAFLIVAVIVSQISWNVFVEPFT